MHDTEEIQNALEEIAALLALSGESRFKAEAYQRGAAALAKLQGLLPQLIAEERLTDVAGVGPSLARQILELWHEGRSPLLDQLRAANPPGAAELAQLPGLTRARIQVLHDALGITSRAALREACEAQRVRALKGFGEKSERRLLDALHRPEAPVARQPGGLLLAEALRLSARMAQALTEAEPGMQVWDAGALRRREEVLDVLELALLGGAPPRILDALASQPEVLLFDRERAKAGDLAAFAVRGPIWLHAGVPLVLHRLAPETAGLELLRATGPMAHLRALAQRARERDVPGWAERLCTGGGCALPDPLPEAEGTRPEPLPEGARDEPAVYGALQLSYIPAELRAQNGVIDDAARGNFDDLLEEMHLRGAVHCHTTHSDGKHSIEDMARAAETLGLEYITITDHSPAAHYARGVALDRLARQWDEIAEAQQHVNIRILRGTESDILEDGSLDYPDQVLEQFDVVIASIHARHRMNRKHMTARLERAMQLPLFKIWGHPLGRLLLEREPIDCDVERVLEALRSSRGAIEVNGDPHRLDLPPPWIARARALGIPFVISADAHSTAGLGALRYGVMIARRGGLRRSDVLNTLPCDAFLARVRPSPSFAREPAATSR